MVLAELRVGPNYDKLGTQKNFRKFFYCISGSLRAFAVDCCNKNILLITRPDLNIFLNNYTVMFLSMNSIEVCMDLRKEFELHV